MKQKGSALILAMITGMIIISFAGSAIFMATSDYRFSSQEAQKMKARYVAESGLARGIKYMNANFTNSAISFSDVDQLANLKIYDKTAFNAPYKGNSVKMGEYTVEVKVLTGSDMEVPSGKDISGNYSNSVRFISLVSTGFIPNATNPKAQITITAVYEMATQVSHVFDYSYFINNWGWLYGNNIISIGNVKSNGTFSFGSYKPKIYGKPRFADSEGTELIGYIDDNGDGKENGADGGVYAWNQIEGSPASNPKADLYQGLKGVSTNPEVPQEPMPNLNNFDMYEAMSQEQGSYVKIGNQTICNGVVGDKNGTQTKQHLYLEGTKTNPVEIHGTIVVYGDVVIRGWVTGKGVIYSGRNIYIPQRILYVDAPGERQPGTNSESSREQWRRRYDECDMLGLFARENIVLADYTNSTWQNNVKNELANTKNKSAEDSGADKIPNTGDAGEGDGKWTVEVDAKNEPIAGTGEDIDGDGKPDVTTKIEEFNLKSALTNTSTWTGNIPSGVTSYTQICYWNEGADDPASTATRKEGNQTINNVTHFPQVDAVLYTNHWVAGRVSNTSYNYKNDNKGTFTSGSQAGRIVINGSMICRNEAIYYNVTNSIEFVHDERLTAEDGTRFGMVLPRIWKPLTLVSMNYK